MEPVRDAINMKGAPAGDVSWVKNRYFDIPYAEQSPAQKLDLYLPEEGNGPFPIVVHIHGGAWLWDDKRDVQVEPWLQLINRGYALASINYRFSSEAIFPGPLMDCKCAIRWLRKHAAEYNLNPEYVAVVGASVGANMAEMIAASAGVPELEDLSQGCGDEPSDVAACIAWFGPTDFSTMDSELASLELGPCDHNEADSPESRYLGRQLTLLSHEEINRANPATYISETMAPMLIQHGTKDSTVPYYQSTALAEAIEKKLGPNRVTLELIAGAVHADAAFRMKENMERCFSWLDHFMK